MKTKILTAIALIALMSCMISTVAAVAPPAPDTNTYAVAKTSPADPVNMPSIVTLTATTSNTEVTTVVFTWYAPGDWDAVNNLPIGPYAYNTTDSDKADGGFTSSNPVDEPGIWTVVATFEKIEVGGSVLKPIWGLTTQVEAKTNFFVLPEYPLIGSAGVFVAMGLGLLLFKRKAIGNQLF